MYAYSISLEENHHYEIHFNLITRVPVDKIFPEIWIVSWYQLPHQESQTSHNRR